MKPRVLAMAILTAAVVITAIGYQVMSSGLRRDAQAVTDLTALASKIEAYQSKKNKMPAKLSDLSVNSKLEDRLNRYSYSVKKGTKFELCADFSRSAKPEEEESQDDPIYSLNSGASDSLLAQNKTIASQVKSHDKGKQCYTQDADPYSYYSPYSSSLKSSLDASSSSKTKSNSTDDFSTDSYSTDSYDDSYYDDSSSSGSIDYSF